MAVRAGILAALVALGLSGCAGGPGAGVQAVVRPSAPVSFEQAILNAGDAVFLAASAAGPRVVVIDPLVNGVTGEQSASTRALGERLAALAREKYPQMQVRPFAPEAVAAAPLVMVGTFTPVNAANQTAGAREMYRFCLVLADLRTGRVVAKKVVWATLDGVDGTPLRAFAESPGWTDDAQVKAYIDTCQSTQVGDPIPAIYLDGLVTAAILNQATQAYDSGRYPEALALYGDARSSPRGEQLRTFNGLYLTRARLGPAGAAETAFGDLVDFGLRRGRLAVKLLFRPASTAFVSDARVAGAYDMWLRQIAARGAASRACLQVTGHTSASGAAALNERLSVLRAEAVKGRLERDSPALAGRVVATGEGAKAALVGTGKDDGTDALDRRVEFKVLPACT